jgi:hypothetical protein
MSLTPDQIAFVRIHQTGVGHNYVSEWKHVFLGATIRATTNKGKTATLDRDAVQELVDAGLMTTGYGGSFHLTDAGKAL